MKLKTYVCLVVGLVGCGGSGGDGLSAPKASPQANMTGTWNGTLIDQGNTFQLNLIVANDTVTHQVTGTATFVASGGSVVANVSGIFTPPTASLILTSGATQPSQLSGTISGKAWVATLNGSGFVNDALTLTKQ
jgi:hypothetical protein